MFDTMCGMGIGGSHTAELHRVLDEMLAVVPADLGDATLHDDVIELQAVTARLTALKAARVAEWARRALWNTDGSTCASSRLATEAGLAPSAARDEVRRANALGEMPATAEALAAGDITVAHVDLLARANSAGREGDFARDEDLLVEDCTTMAFDDAHQAVDYWMLSADTLRHRPHHPSARRRHHQLRQRPRAAFDPQPATRQTQHATPTTPATPIGAHRRARHNGRHDARTRRTDRTRPTTSPSTQAGKLTWRRATRTRGLSR